MTPRQNYINTLRGLAKQVTHEDIMAAKNEIPISEPTLNKYLSGDVVKTDIADRIIEFFSERLRRKVESEQKDIKTF